MTRVKLPLVLVSLLLASRVFAAEDGPTSEQPEIALVSIDDKFRFEVRGLGSETLDKLRSDDWTEDQSRALFCVRTAGAADDLPALMGRYQLDGDVLVFVPRFALRRGQRYEVRLEFGGSRLTQRFDIGDRVRKETTELVGIFPTGNVLPENQLKFYLHFSRPMSRGEAYRHIHLLDKNDQEVEFPFLELPEELWDRELKRFTLFFDPGRIKRGLKPREEFGPPIVEGQTYTLAIDESWLDADGQPLSNGLRKSFRVVAPDDTQPDPARWQVTAPPAASRSPLTIQFNEPLDHAMLHRVVQVVDSSGVQVAGEVVTAEEETEWRLTPSSPWRPGDYEILIDTRLEDLAGNSIARPFEVDLFDTVQRAVPMSSTRLQFEVR